MQAAKDKARAFDDARSKPKDEEALDRESPISQNLCSPILLRMIC